MLPVTKKPTEIWAIRLIVCLYLLRATVNGDTTTTSSSSAQVGRADPTFSQPAAEDSDDEIKIEEDESEVASGGPYYKRNVNTPENENASSSASTESWSPSTTSALAPDTAVAKILELYDSRSQSVRNTTAETHQNNSGAVDVANSTKLVKTTVSCLPKELLLLNENDTSMVVEPTVEIVNFTKLIQEVLLINTSIKAKTTPANCTVVYFYTHWCKFSAKAAAHVNALARVFPSIRIVGIDCSLHSTVSSHFGVLAVPTILLFHNGKTIAKFNDTSFTLNKFAEFIQYYTDQKCDEKILNVTSKDFQGPIPSTPSQERDVWLLLAWVFIIACFIYYTSRSTLWRRICDLIRTTWREAEAQHEHID